jgi:hypothetical protein
LLIYTCGLKAKNSKIKGQKKYFPALPTAWDKAVGKAGLFSQQNMPALPTGFLCQQLCPVALPTAGTSCWQSPDV